MDELLLKYYTLNRSAQDELRDFLDFLWQKKQKGQALGLSDYKKKILNVSTWSDQDIQSISDAQQHFNQWPIKSW